MTPAHARGWLHSARLLDGPIRRLFVVLCVAVVVVGVALLGLVIDTASTVGG